MSACDGDDKAAGLLPIAEGLADGFLEKPPIRQAVRRALSATAQCRLLYA
jgi:hypothetical protein